MTDDVTVRPAEPGDGEEMARIWVETGRYYAGLNADLFQIPSEEGLAQDFEAEAASVDESHGALLVAELDGRLTGYIGVRLVDPVQSPATQLVRYVGEAHTVVDLLVVEPASWRQGVGGLLLHSAEAWGKERGATLVRLETYVDSPVSVPFYEKRMGYQRRALIFEKQL
ncbi:MAG TPA: GNAT family N-acetyltransferase [Actinomycetota bacterium]|nr:GNAT family N-acetyltransferase [Actinomycetota bacterium]